MVKDNFKPDVVIYHSNCSDGYASKFICQKKWGNIPVYKSKAHTKNQNIADVDFEYKNKNVLFVDFAYDDKEIMVEICKEAKEVILVDHHLSAIEKYGDIDFNLKCIFDTTKSASVLLWDSLYPGVKVPLILKYVEDRDLRLWRMPHVHEVLSVLDTLPKDREQWKIFNNNLENNIGEIVQKGLMIKQVFNGYLHTILSQKKELNIAGHNGAVVNASWEFTAYAADVLAEKYDFGMAWFLDSNNLVKCSFRSKNGLDVKKIAEAFGGGGHIDNAGCTISLIELDHMLNKDCGLNLIQIANPLSQSPVLQSFPEKSPVILRKKNLR